MEGGEGVAIPESGGQATGPGEYVAGGGGDGNS